MIFACKSIKNIFIKNINMRKNTKIIAGRMKEGEQW